LVSISTRSYSGLSFGFTVGVMSLIIFAITTAYITTTVILIRIKRSLQENLTNLRANGKEQYALYEELDYRTESVKSSSPTIDTGENAAYSSAATESTITRNVTS
jgi:hypothetical protein